MLKRVIEARANGFTESLLNRGYSVVYRPEEVNHCPGCGRSHWYVGRLSAECGFCGTAIPMADASTQGSGGGHSRNRKWIAQQAWAA